MELISWPSICPNGSLSETSEMSNPPRGTGEGSGFPRQMYRGNGRSSNIVARKVDMLDMCIDNTMG